MNPETKFTKGPWRVDPGHKHDIQTSGGEFEIASVAGSVLRVGEKPDFDARTANAHLIAAAPEMYEALVSLLTAIDVVQAIPGPKGLELRQKASAALAKARGGSA